MASPSSYQLTLETIMPDPAKALATQLANIEKRTGKSLAQFARILKASGLAKHGELRDFLKREFGMGHGDANTLVHHAAVVTESEIELLRQSNSALSYNPVACQWKLDAVAPASS